jgi:hypothetical protein
MAGFFFNDEFSTPDAIDRRRALINALSKENLSTAPVQHWTQGLARVLGAAADGYEGAKLNEAEKKGVEANKAALMAAFGMGGAPTQLPGAAPADPVGSSWNGSGQQVPSVSRETAPPAPIPPGKPQAATPAGAPSWAGAMPTMLPTGSLDQSGTMPKAPSPMIAMAPNSGQPSERELVIRTIAAETSGKSPQEAQAIAAVILNRAKTRGLSPADVVLERNQFEPWNAGPGGRNDPMNIDPNSPRYQQAAQALAAASGGQDPTGGATHFFAPAAQAALGRNAPAWAQGPGQQIGATAFYAPEGRAPGGAVPVGDMAAPGAQTAEQPMQRPAPGQFVNPMQGGGQMQRPGVNPALLQALASPWAAKNPMLAQLGAKVAGDQLTGTQFGFQVVGENLVRTNPRTGQVEVVPNVSPAKPQWGVIGEANGQKQYGFINPVAQSVTPYQGNPTNAPPKFDDVTSLRKEISALPEVKNYTVALPAYNTMVRASKDNSAAGDLAFVYGLAKVFDPDSVVREGEMKFSEASQSIPEQVLGTIRRVVAGETRLDANTKEQLIGVVNQRMTEMKQQYDTRLGGFQPTFDAYKIDPKLVLPSTGDVLPVPKLNRTSIGTVAPGAPAAPAATAKPAKPQDPNAGWTEIAPGVRIREKK